MMSLTARCSQLLLCCMAPIGRLAVAADSPATSARAVAASDFTAWGMGLLLVLSVFFLCVWVVNRINGQVNPAEKMRIVSGLSLGLREKIIVLQVGKKQLILAVTPGRIETLHVLEGDDCLLKDDTGSRPNGAGFAQKLMQAMNARPEA